MEPINPELAAPAPKPKKGRGVAKNKLGGPVRKRITLRLPSEFFKALGTMAAASGMNDEDEFASQLMEISIIDAYRARFGTTITGWVRPDDSPKPEPTEEI
jgi:hypothetical protein